MQLLIATFLHQRISGSGSGLQSLSTQQVEEKPVLIIDILIDLHLQADEIAWLHNMTRRRHYIGTIHSGMSLSSHNFTLYPL